MAISKELRSRLKYARYVIAAGRANADGIVSGIQALHGADAIDPAGTRAEILGKCDLLGRATNRLEVDSQALEQEITEDIKAREQRDERAGLLGDVMVSVRGRVRDRLGTNSMRLYRLDERNPESREGLARYASDVQGLLQLNPLDLTDVLGSSVTTVDLAGHIGTVLDTYRNALDDVAREARETERARAIRDRSEQRFRRVLVNVAAIIIAYLRLAGMDELAARIRATRARTGAAPGDEQPGDEQPDIDLPDLEPPVESPSTAS